MLLHGHVFTASDGLRGFDTDYVVSAGAAAAFREHGYKFCVRYVRRATANPARDLSAAEAQWILDAGLGLMVVQYFESEKGWTPTGEKGANNGKIAAAESAKHGLPPGVTVWCDLEAVAPGTDAEQVIDYCNQWHREVAAEGYVPGLYVGWGCGLNPTQLYKSLRFSHYWGAYNLNSDQVPAVRNLQMKQKVAKKADKVALHKHGIQTDTVRKDALGGLPTLVAPEGWPG
jgi:hypothetical protein